MAKDSLRENKLLRSKLRSIPAGRQTSLPRLTVVGKFLHCFTHPPASGGRYSRSLNKTSGLRVRGYFVLGMILGAIIITAVSIPKFFLPSDKVFSKTSVNDILPAFVSIVVSPSPTPTPTPQQLTESQKLSNSQSSYGLCRYTPILIYHHVMNSQKASEILATNLNISPDVFRQQIDYLIGNGYQIIGLDEMMNGLQTSSLPSRPAVLTFDDGYSDFYDNAFPVLKEKNIKATVFVISQLVGGERYLSWEQIREMADSGLILIGDHTLNHLSLSQLSREEQHNQIVSAKNIIEEQIKKPVSFFAYPYGDFNPQAEEILKEAGFSGAVTVGHSDPQCTGLPYELSRIRIGPVSLKNFGL
ncbi:MAG: polysaccharide deacetylase family protein [bacterium]|nr:polysaccharide deacetylase family protein [bacterium]